MSCPVIPRWMTRNNRSDVSDCVPPRTRSMAINLPRRVTPRIREPGNCSPSATGSSIKSVLPRRTSRMVLPGNEARNPRTTVSTSGSSGMTESTSKIAQSSSAGWVKSVKLSRQKRNWQPVSAKDLHKSPVTKSRQRQPRRRHNSGHSQNLLVFLFRNRGNNQPHIFQELQFAHRRVRSQFVEGNLAWQAFHGAQVRNEHFRVQIVRIRVGVPANLRNRVKGPLGSRMVTKHTIALAYHFEGSDGIRSCSCSTPHLLA